MVGKKILVAYDGSESADAAVAKAIEAAKPMGSVTLLHVYWDPEERKSDLLMHSVENAEQDAGSRIFRDIEPTLKRSKLEYDMRVEQQLHGLPSNSSMRPDEEMRSKSSGTEISPAIKPVLCLLDAASSASGTTFTMGLPALAMMNELPRAASSTRRERCVFASCILIVCMSCYLISIFELSSLNLV